MYQFLEKSEGAYPAAGKPAHERSHEGKEAPHVEDHPETFEGHFGGPFPEKSETVLEPSHRAGEGGKRAGMTVKSRRTDPFQRSLVSRAGCHVTEERVEQQQGGRLGPPAVPFRTPFRLFDSHCRVGRVVR